MKNMIFDKKIFLITDLVLYNKHNREETFPALLCL